MSCLLSMCIGKWCIPKIPFVEDETEETPSLYEDVMQTTSFKLKMLKKERKLKAEMKQREILRQKQRDKLNKMQFDILS